MVFVRTECHNCPKMSKWIGYAVSVNCGEPLGCYQGTILEADGTTITLTKAFRNGFPYPKSQVTLNAADIKDLKIIESKAEPAEQTHSTVAVTKNNKKTNRATVCENLQANQTNTGIQPPVCVTNNNVKTPKNHSMGPATTRSKPIDIQGPRPNKNNNHAGSYGNTGSTPKGRGGGSGGGGGAGGGGGGGGAGGGGGGGHEKARRRNEACFGDAAEPALDDDFDFEGNLALFDKRALWEQMRGAKPDLLRQADDGGKFRHDENVLGAPPPPRSALLVPAELRGARDYVTDEGVPVPAVVPRLRRQLWDGLQRHGLLDFSYTLLARAAADVALRLVGGGRRLEPRNAHQAPCVVALAGAHRAGAAGLAAARLLASHGARAFALRPAGAAGACAALRRELAAAALGDVRLAATPGELPSPDVVLLALYDPQLDDAQEAHAAALAWARGARAAAVALEPPARGWEGVAARASVLALAPAALPAALGRVYLADVAPPACLFAEHGLTYRPPFGAAPLLALHPADD